MHFELDYTRIIDQYPLKATIAADVRVRKGRTYADLSACGIVGHPKLRDMPALFPLLFVEVPLEQKQGEEKIQIELDGYSESVIPLLSRIMSNGGNTQPNIAPNTPKSFKRDIRPSGVGERIAEARAANQKYRSEMALWHLHASGIENMIKVQLFEKYPEKVVEEYLWANYYNFMRSMGVRTLRDGLLGYMEEKTESGKELVTRWRREYFEDNISLNQDAPSIRQEDHMQANQEDKDLIDHLRNKLLSTTIGLSRSGLII